MVTRRMSAKEARDNFSDLLASVYYGQEPVIVERKGKPFAVVISPKEYEHYQQQQKEQLFQTIDAIRERNRDKDPQEIEADIAAAVAEVRAEEDAPADTTTDRP